MDKGSFYKESITIVSAVAMVYFADPRVLHDMWRLLLCKQGAKFWKGNVVPTAVP